MASTAAPAAARSFSSTYASSGTGVAGAVARSATAPTQSTHSFGASVANNDRARNHTTTARVIRFMSGGLKGLMLLNPSAGVKLPPAEQTALEDAARAEGLEVAHASRDLDC